MSIKKALANHTESVWLTRALLRAVPPCFLLLFVKKKARSLGQTVK